MHSLLLNFISYALACWIC